MGPDFTEEQLCQELIRACGEATGLVPKISRIHVAQTSSDAIAAEYRPLAASVWVTPRLVSVVRDHLRDTTKPPTDDVVFALQALFHESLHALTSLSHRHFIDEALVQLTTLNFFERFVAALGLPEVSVTQLDQTPEDYKVRVDALRSVVDAAAENHNTDVDTLLRKYVVKSGRLLPSVRLFSKAVPTDAHFRHVRGVKAFRQFNALEHQLSTEVSARSL